MYRRANILLSCLLFYHLMHVCCSSTHNDSQRQGDDAPPHISDHRFFLQEIFTKYGHEGQMTFEGFEHLLESLGLGNVIIRDHDVTAHREADAFKETHDTHEHFADSSAPDPSGQRIQSLSRKISLPLPKRINPKDSNPLPSAASSHDLEQDEDPSPSQQSPKDNPNRRHVGRSHSHRYGSKPGASHEDHHHDADHHHHHETDATTTTIPHLINSLTSLVDEHKELEAEAGEKARKQCLTPQEILHTFHLKPESNLNPISFLHLCPAIIYELDQRHCLAHDHSEHEEGNSQGASTNQWLYASLSVLLISLCGLFSVAVIPIMQKWFYQTMLQFLVGLAVGSLSGDALLHLMPHAMLSGGDDHDHGGVPDTREQDAVWKGMAALGGIYFFFVAERLLNALTSYRRMKKTQKVSKPSKMMIPMYSSAPIENNVNVGEKLSQYRKNSYGGGINGDVKETLQMLKEPEQYNGSVRKDSGQSLHDVAFHGRSSFSADPEPGVMYHAATDSTNYVVTVDEHHGHGHGHSHEVPQSVSAVAWMVIMGDGLHNFCDGLAIGAAFGSGIAGGISTTVAVFCHELPHELGDFAMLLKTGMKVKQALMYNGLSSVLCFIGMTIGVSLGNVSSATTWVFAGTAGMFLYIALVDMLPELGTASNHPGSTTTYLLAVQVLGISIGVTVMLLIALYEHDLKFLVS